MKIWFAISLLSTALWSVSAANNLVKIKNNSEFDKTIQKNDMVLVKFSGPKCADCKKVESKIEKAADLLENDKVLVAEVDCQANMSVCKKYNIRTFPTLQVFKEGRPSNLIKRGKRLSTR
jgi:thioredoxin-like negative regulator of GroEL